MNPGATKSNRPSSISQTEDEGAKENSWTYTQSEQNKTPIPGMSSATLIDVMNCRFIDLPVVQRMPNANFEHGYGNDAARFRTNELASEKQCPQRDKNPTDNGEKLGIEAGVLMRRECKRHDRCIRDD